MTGTSGTDHQINDTDIAVIGMACRFPGASDLDTFWRNIRDGVDSITRDPAGDDPDVVHAAAILDDIEKFDAAFFGYSAQEARLLDPQHRLFLECAWEALEDAGHVERGDSAAIGVYGGTGPNTYLLNNLHRGDKWRPDRRLVDSGEELALLMASDKDFLTSRVSYKLNLRGPSLNLQAACATGLFAVHYACQGLLNGECDVALAGAASIQVPQVRSYRYEPGLVFSPDGRTRAFDANASGTVFGSGVGVVALKLLRDAIADGDPVHAVIKGTAVNNDGASKMGMSAPSASGQAAVIAEALQVAGVSPRSVSYVEGHGTGTPLGDPIEVAALTRAFGSGDGTWCALGSVKTNVGHLGWAAGMAGLFKTVQALRHRQIPPSLHYRAPNPQIDFASSPFYVNTELADWPTADGPRRAGVSAFGLGGVNAHVVMEEAPAPRHDTAPDDAGVQVLPLSARTEEGLRELAARYRDHLDAHPDQHVSDVAYTAATTRRHFEHRISVRATDRTSAHEQLSAVANGDAAGNRVAGTPRVAMLFTGYRPDFRGVGRDLYQSVPLFRDCVDATDDVMRECLGVTASDLLYGDVEPPHERWFAHAQPVQFVVQVALARLWQSWGINPAMVVGHSVGEFAAAAIAGVFDVEDGLRLVAERSRLVCELPPGGAMAAVSLDEDDARAEIAKAGPGVSIAALNGPSSTVLAGRGQALHRLCDRLAAAGVRVRDLGYAMAAHSAEVDSLLDPFEQFADRIRFSPPQLDVVSNVTGTKADDAIATSAYWRRHLREPVRFAEGVRTVAAAGVDAFLEIGPAPVLLGMANAVLPDHPGPWLPSLRPGTPDLEQLADSLGELYAAGADVEWDEVYARPRRRTTIPTYPFQRQRHWVDAPAGTEVRALEGASAQQPARSRPWQDLLHEVRWQVLPDGASRRLSGEWVVVADSGGVGTALADSLRAGGARCTLVRSGTGFGIDDEGVRTLDPENHTHWHRLLDDIGAPLAGLVHLSSLDTPALPDTAAELLARGDSTVDAARTGCGTALSLLQVLVNRPGAAAKLWLVTRDVHVVAPDDRGVGLAQSPLWGAARIVAIEHPDLVNTRVDLAAGDSRSQADALLRALRSGDDGEPEIALRGDARYAPRLVRTSAEGLRRPELVPDAVYMVVGGTRGLGLLTAEQLVDLGARNLVLVGRNEPGAESAAAIDQLRRRGVEIFVEQADVADPGSLEKVFSSIDELGLPLRGIVHTAVVIDDGTLEQLDWSRFASVLGPKAQGAWNLHVLTAEHDHQLDFCLYFSSATSLIGNSGQANYSAANAFLDVLAHHRRANGMPATAVNWGPWTGTGFLAGQNDLLAHLERTGMGAFDVKVGSAALAHLLGTDRTQVGVLPANWATFLDWQDQTGNPFFADVAPRNAVAAPNAGSDVATRIAGADGSEREQLIVQHVRAQARKLLGATVGDDDQLVGHGMDSLSAIQLRNGLQTTLSCTLPTTLCFQHPTVRAIADHLCRTVLVGEWAPSASRAKAVPVAMPVRTDESAPTPLSRQQRRWRRLLSIGYGTLVIPILVHAALDRTALRTALLSVVSRHDVLRQRFDDTGAHRVDIEDVLPSDDVLFTDLSGLDGSRRYQALAEHAEAARNSMPDWENGVPWTIRCLDLGGDRFMLLLSLQHLEFDGVSISVFTDELREDYRDLVAGRTPRAGKPVQYREFVEWQQRYLSGPVAEDRAFFTGLYNASPGRTLLPGHSGSTITESHRSGRFTPVTGPEVWSAVRDAAIAEGVPPFSLLCAAYFRLLAEITGDDDITVGTIVTGRPDSHFDRTIGPFVAPFPIAVRTAGRTTGQLAAECTRIVAAINARCAYPPADMVTHVPPFAGLPEDTYFTDPFIMFTNYQKEEAAAEPRVEVLECLAPLEDADLAGMDAPTLAEIAGLFLIIDVWQDVPRFNFWYHLHRFSGSQVESWATRYLDILGEAMGRDHVADGNAVA